MSEDSGSQIRSVQLDQHNSNMKLSACVALAAASSASAHSIFVSLNSGAVGDGVRVVSYDGVSPFPTPASTYTHPNTPHSPSKM